MILIKTCSECGKSKHPKEFNTIEINGRKKLSKICNECASNDVELFTKTFENDKDFISVDELDLDGED